MISPPNPAIHGHIPESDTLSAALACCPFMMIRDSSVALLSSTVFAPDDSELIIRDCGYDETKVSVDVYRLIRDCGNKESLCTRAGICSVSPAKTNVFALKTNS